MPRYRSASIFASSSSKMHLNLIIQKNGYLKSMKTRKLFGALKTMRVLRDLYRNNSRGESFFPPTFLKNTLS